MNTIAAMPESMAHLNEELRLVLGKLQVYQARLNKEREAAKRALDAAGTHEERFEQAERVGWAQTGQGYATTATTIINDLLMPTVSKLVATEPKAADDPLWPVIDIGAKRARVAV